MLQGTVCREETIVDGVHRDAYEIFEHNVSRQVGPIVWYQCQGKGISLINLSNVLRKATDAKIQFIYIYIYIRYIHVYTCR